MQIDNCGSNSEILASIYNSIMEKNIGEGKNALISADDLDDYLFVAYQRMLSVTRDNGIIAQSLKNLGKMVEHGNIKIEDIANVATMVTIATMEDKHAAMSTETNIDISMIAVMTDSIVLEKLTQNMEKVTDFELEIINNLCTEEMMRLHKDTFESAKNGNDKSVITLDLVNKAINYMTMSEKLNPKGKEAGALALMYQLLDVGEEEARAMADKLAKHFDITEVEENGELNADKVKSRFEEIKPNCNIEEVKKREQATANNSKNEIIEKSARSINTSIVETIEKKKIREFNSILNETISNNDRKLIDNFIQSNIRLARKSLVGHEMIYDKFIKGKKAEPEKFSLRRQYLKNAIMKNHNEKGEPDNFLEVKNSDIELFAAGENLGK